jgi:hypothetical protein
MGYRRRGDEFHFFLAAKNNKNIREIYLILEKLAIIATIAIIQIWRQSYRIISWNNLANRICLVTLINYHPY